MKKGLKIPKNISKDLSLEGRKRWLKGYTNVLDEFRYLNMDAKKFKKTTGFALSIIAHNMACYIAWAFEDGLRMRRV